MDAQQILIKYDGRDADKHTVDMRLLGRSLQGFDRIISDGIILLSEKRLPKHGERAILKVQAKEPVVGTQSIVGLIQDNAGLLPLGWQLLTDSTGAIISHWVSFVLEHFSGRPDAAEKHLKAIMELNRDHIAARDKSDERWLAEQAQWRDQLFALANKLAIAATQAVAPVGPSVRNVQFSAGQSSPFEVDEAMADAIRSKGELSVGDLQRMTLKTEGVRDHTRSLFVVHPDEDGYITANVKDPIFDEWPNAYTEAASRKATIQVQAKPAYRAGRMERIYIMDFEKELE